MSFDSKLKNLREQGLLTREHALATTWPLFAALVLAILQFGMLPTGVQIIPAAPVADAAGATSAVPPAAVANPAAAAETAAAAVTLPKKLTLTYKDLFTNFGVYAQDFFNRFFTNLLACLGVQIAGWLGGNNWLGRAIATAFNKTISPEQTAQGMQPIAGSELSVKPEETVRTKIAPVLAGTQTLVQRVATLGGTNKEVELSYCRVLLLGRGNTGKTHFIDSLLRYKGNHHDRPNPNRKTGDTRIYYLNHQCAFHGGKINETTRRRGANESCMIELTDYRGQTINDYRAWLHMANAAGNQATVNAIVFLVDLFEGDGTEAGADCSKPNDTRIDENIKDWERDIESWININGNGAARPHYCCLYINKMDLLDMPGLTANEKEKTVKAAYKKLYDKMLTYSAEMEKPECLVGSIIQGTHMPHLLLKFKQAAESLHPSS